MKPKSRGSILKRVKRNQAKEKREREREGEGENMNWKKGSRHHQETYDCCFQMSVTIIQERDGEEEKLFHTSNQFSHKQLKKREMGVKTENQRCGSHPLTDMESWWRRWWHEKSWKWKLSTHVYCSRCWCCFCWCWYKTSIIITKGSNEGKETKCCLEGRTEEGKNALGKNERNVRKRNEIIFKESFSFFPFVVVCLCEKRRQHHHYLLYLIPVACSSSFFVTSSTAL